MVWCVMVGLNALIHTEIENLVAGVVSITLALNIATRPNRRNRKMDAPDEP